MTIKIKADNEHPIPERMNMEKAPTPMEELEVAENTAQLMKEHAEPIDITKEDKKEAEKLFKNFQKVMKLWLENGGTRFLEANGNASPSREWF